MNLRYFLIVCVPTPGLFDRWEEALPGGGSDCSPEYYDHTWTDALQLLADHLTVPPLSPTPGAASAGGVLFCHTFTTASQPVIVLSEQFPTTMFNAPQTGTRLLFLDPAETRKWQKLLSGQFVLRKRDLPGFFKPFRQLSQDWRKKLNLDFTSSSFLGGPDSAIVQAFWQAHTDKRGAEVYIFPELPEKAVLTTKGWMGPFVFHLDVGENNISSHYQPNEVSGANVLQKLLRPECLKYVQPLISRENDLRWAFFSVWWKRIKNRVQRTEGVRVTEGLQEPEGTSGQFLTSLERLIFQPGNRRQPALPGGYEECRWYPFFVLDLLGGTWHIRDFGTTNLKFFWKPPRNSARNLLWFAEYWVNLWGGELEDAETPLRESVTPPVLPRTPFRAQVCGLEHFGSCDWSVVDFLEQHPDAKKLGTMREMLLEVLSQDELRDQDGHLHSEFLSIHQECLWMENGRLMLSPQSFLDRECRQRLLPLSPVLVEFPSIDALFVSPGVPEQLKRNVEDEQNLLNKYCFDIIESHSGGAAELFRQILHSFDTDWDAADHRVELRYSKSSAWPTEYVGLVTQRPSDTRVRLVPDPVALQLGTGLLGWAHLGAGETTMTGPSYRGVEIYV
ncbi:MAG: hypothetical protein ACFCD0_16420 [Gemmataceae bacterium]